MAGRAQEPHLLWGAVPDAAPSSVPRVLRTMSDIQDPSLAAALARTWHLRMLAPQPLQSGVAPLLGAGAFSVERLTFRSSALELCSRTPSALACAGIRAMLPVALVASGGDEGCVADAAVSRLGRAVAATMHAACAARQCVPPKSHQRSAARVASPMVGGEGLVCGDHARTPGHCRTRRYAGHSAGSPPFFACSSSHRCTGQPSGPRWSPISSAFGSVS